MISSLLLIYRLHLDAVRIWSLFSSAALSETRQKTVSYARTSTPTCHSSEDLTMRRNLLAIAILFACLVHANTGWAQTDTVDDIQIAPAGSAAAFYVPATGEVILSVGAGLSAVDVSGSADSVADDFIVENFDGSTPLGAGVLVCLLYTSPSPRDGLLSRMPSSA